MNIYSISINEIKLDKNLVKQLKQLSRNTTGEQLKIFDGDLAIIAKFNTKVVGMCNIAMISPESHFTNETDKKIPYLYNYMCSHSHHSKKVSVAIMTFIKDLINVGEYEKEINLDVMVDNDHAINFFKKNQCLIEFM